MWISPDCHGIVAVLVSSGKQPSSGLLHTLRFVCVCVWPLSAVCYNIASSSHRGNTLVFPGTRSYVSPHRLTSTTQPLRHCARVYHIIRNIVAFHRMRAGLDICSQCILPYANGPFRRVLVSLGESRRCPSGDDGKSSGRVYPGCTGQIG